MDAVTPLPPAALAAAENFLPLSVVNDGETIKLSDRNGNSVASMMFVSLRGRHDPDAISALAKLLVEAVNARHTSAPARELSALRAEVAALREALETIRDAFWSDGETPAEQVADLKGIALAALSPGGEREGDGWRPIETAPKDGTAILAVIGLYRRDQSFSHWERHIIAFDQDRGAISPDHDQGWDWEDYEGWQPLPAPPLAPQEAGR